MTYTTKGVFNGSACKPRLGRCGECKSEPWLEGSAMPPCDDSYCTAPYWEPMPQVAAITKEIEQRRARIARRLER